METVWPPQYTIRKHKRAKYVKLRAHSRRGLEITIPYRYKLHDVSALLEENKEWIIKQLAQLPIAAELTLPDEIHCVAIDEKWQVRYMQSDAKLKLYVRPARELVIVGDINDKTTCQKLILLWVRKQAKQFLEQELKQLSEYTGLHYTRITIRSQQSVWGSCTAKKALNLNDRLLFLPLTLVRYVIIHELCHTRHHNHSVAFWDLVGRFVPAWRAHRRELREANRYMPSWL
jgi:predicted metal-dependent hydrolase